MASHVDSLGSREKAHGQRSARDGSDDPFGGRRLLLISGKADDQMLQFSRTVQCVELIAISYNLSGAIRNERSHPFPFRRRRPMMLAIDEQNRDLDARVLVAGFWP